MCFGPVRSELLSSCQRSERLRRGFITEIYTALSKSIRLQRSWLDQVVHSHTQKRIFIYILREEWGINPRADDLQQVISQSAVTLSNYRGFDLTTETWCVITHTHKLDLCLKNIHFPGVSHFWNPHEGKENVKSLFKNKKFRSSCFLNKLRQVHSFCWRTDTDSLIPILILSLAEQISHGYITLEVLIEPRSHPLYHIYFSLGKICYHMHQCSCNRIQNRVIVELLVY